MAQAHSATQLHQRFPAVGGEGTKAILWRNGLIGLLIMGELSPARHALDGAPIAPGNEQILNSLRDPERRPLLLHLLEFCITFQMRRSTSIKNDSWPICVFHVVEQQEVHPE